MYKLKPFYKMKRIILCAIALIMPFAAALAQDVIGKWKLADGTAIVEVYKSGDSFNGKIVWLQNPTESDGTPAKDDNNPDKNLRSRQIMGLNMLRRQVMSTQEEKFMIRATERPTTAR